MINDNDVHDDDNDEDNDWDVNYDDDCDDYYQIIYITPIYANYFRSQNLD